VTEQPELVPHDKIGVGFYASDQWPLWFMVNKPRGDARLTLWGWSRWKNVLGYRTFGDCLSVWLARYPNAKVYADKDRTHDREFHRMYRALLKSAKEASK
jgi:hypothetical protein